MLNNDKQITGRDVLAKTFYARSRRGYDPLEVDAYLERLAQHFDELHAAIESNAASSSNGSEDVREALEQRDTAIAERDALAQELTEATSRLTASNQALKSENEEIRRQLMSVAPPPPIMSSDAQSNMLGQDNTPAAETPVEELAIVQSTRNESYELVLASAKTAAEDAIGKAHERAREIVEAAEHSAVDYMKNAELEALEAKAGLTSELNVAEEEVRLKELEIEQLNETIRDRIAEIRSAGERLLNVADEANVPDRPAVATTDTSQSNGDVLDLRAENVQTS